MAVPSRRGREPWQGQGDRPRSEGRAACPNLSAKAKAGELVILDTAILAEAKTASLAKAVQERGWKRVLVIDGATVDGNFALAARNIEGLDVLPTIGANVYDILKRDTLVITKAGVEALEARLK
mgnify:CR=1 FL=1